MNVSGLGGVSMPVEILAANLRRDDQASSA